MQEPLEPQCPLSKYQWKRTEKEPKACPRIVDKHLLQILTRKAGDARTVDIYLIHPPLKGAPCLRRKTLFREKAPGKKKYVRGKRDHKLTGPGRTVWVVRTGRRGEEEVERVCSDRHETCTLYLQLLEPDNLYVNSSRFWRSLVPHLQRLAVPGLFWRDMSKRRKCGTKERQKRDEFT